MACFWKGLIKALNLSTNPTQFVNLLQKNAIKTPNITWNGNKLSNKELEENLEWVKSFNSDRTYDGYFCSTCDPFLLLVCELYGVNIDHQYDGHLIKYRNLKNNLQILKFGSTRSHFYFISKN